MEIKALWNRREDEWVAVIIINFLPGKTSWGGIGSDPVAIFYEPKDGKLKSDDVSRFKIG